MITVKEEFLTEEKTRLAIKKGGCEAIVMWLAIKGYVARKNSNGFVPDEAIDELPGAPKHPRKALGALVDCKLRREDGTLGCGLVDQVAFGWRLHDYEDHGTIKEVEDERRRRAREQKANRRAELARIAALRDAGQRGRTDTGQTPDNVRGHERTGATDMTPDTPRPLAHTSGPARAPSPAQPSPEATPEAVVVDLDRETLCPSDLVEMAELVGVFVEFADSRRVDIERLRAEGRIFAGYWTAGSGAGKRRRNWMAKLRQWLLEKIETGTLPKLAPADKSDETGGYGAKSDWA